MNNKYVFVYGSLRPLHYNFKRFRKIYNDIKSVKDGLLLTGYKLYNLGSYPGIKESQLDTIVGTLLTMNETTYDIISNMELNAGYNKKEIFIEGVTATIFIYNGFVIESNLVISGDWDDTLENKIEINNTIYDEPNINYDIPKFKSRRGTLKFSHNSFNSTLQNKLNEVENQTTKKQKEEITNHYLKAKASAESRFKRFKTEKMSTNIVSPSFYSSTEENNSDSN